MERIEEQMLSDFLAIVREAKNIGPGAFREWTSKPEKYMKLGYKGLPIHETLRSIPLGELEKISSIVDFFAGLSVQYLLRYLEEGYGTYTFDLSMHDSRSNLRIPLIDDSEDRRLNELF